MELVAVRHAGSLRARGAMLSWSLGLALVAVECQQPPRRPMPTYEYRCESCGHTFDIVQGFSDDRLSVL